MQKEKIYSIITNNVPELFIICGNLCDYAKIINGKLYVITKKTKQKLQGDILKEYGLGFRIQKPSKFPEELNKYIEEIQVRDLAKQIAKKTLEYDFHRMEERTLIVEIVKQLREEEQKLLKNKQGE